jgi:hypothetical protein
MILANLQNTARNKIFEPLPEVQPPYFELTAISNVSAGVIQGDRLIKTLWLGRKFNPGRYNYPEWDGLDDFGNIAPVGDYVIKVVSNRINVTWDGTLGNTSIQMTGLGKHKSMDVPQSINVVNNSMLIYVTGYGEGENNGTPSGFMLDATQVKIRPLQHLLFTQNNELVTSDNEYIYWFMSNHSDQGNPIGRGFIIRSDIETGLFESFMYGTNYTISGTLYYGVIDRNPIERSAASITVQRTGNYLFSCRKTLGELKVYNKVTGFNAQTLEFSGISSVCADTNNNLWVAYDRAIEGHCIEKFTVDANNGGVTTTNIIITGFSHVLDIATYNDFIAVVDGGTSQQIKAYSSTGQLLWTLGDIGGIHENLNITNTRYLFSRDEGGDDINPKGSITFEPDGSFWFTDPGNFRLMHFDSDRNFIEKVGWLDRKDRIAIDPYNTSRVMFNNLEFDVNHDLPVNECATPKYQWGANISGNDYRRVAIKQVVTFPNGRTYANVSRPNPVFNEIVELDPTILTGMRFTGIINSSAGNWVLYGDYSLRNTSTNNLTTITFNRREFTGTYTAEGNPIWGNIQSYTMSVPTELHPTHRGVTGLPYEVSDSGVQAIFDKTIDAYDIRREGWRFGGVKDGEYKFVASPTTSKDYKGPFPEDGSFDIGNYTSATANAGTRAMAIGPYFIWGYHGEFWKNSQANKFNMYTEYGLWLVHFGATAKDPGIIGGQAPYGFGGNTYNQYAIFHNGKILVFHNDTHAHSGIHRWTIDNLDTIQEFDLSVTI